MGRALRGRRAGAASRGAAAPPSRPRPGRGGEENIDPAASLPLHGQAIGGGRAEQPCRLPEQGAPRPALPESVGSAFPTEITATFFPERGEAVDGFIAVPLTEANKRRKAGGFSPSRCDRTLPPRSPQFAALPPGPGVSRLLEACGGHPAPGPRSPAPGVLACPVPRCRFCI